MTVERWLQAATSDATRRGLERLVPLLEGLARATSGVRESFAAAESFSALEPVATPAPAPVAGGPAVRTSGSPQATALPRRSYSDGAARLTIAEFGRRLRTSRTTAVQVTRQCLQRIAERNPELNAFILVLEEDAVRAAASADRELASGIDRGPLHGVPVSIKDLFDINGTGTTAASRVREGHRAGRDALAISRLRQAGAVLIGKTNLHEFALGTTNEESAFGPAKNPYDPRRSPGGSSGGSAVSVADGMALATLGSDTGGSIRIPAAACGLVGLKPAFGEVPLDGCVPLSASLDHGGPLALSVEDAGFVYDALLGRPAQRRAPARLERVRLGVPRRHFLELVDQEVLAQFEAAHQRLSKAGAQVVELDIPHAGITAAVYMLIVFAEAAAYHAPFLDAMPERYTDPVRLRLEMARFVLGEDYVRALAVRRQLRAEVDAALSRCDALVLPTLPVPATPLGASTVRVGEREEPVRAITLRNTQLFNITGHPAISVPCGITADGLPIGIQLVGPHGGTDALLEVAAAVESALDLA